MHVTVRLFARLREIAGAGELTRQLPDGATAGDAWSAIAGEFPDLAGYSVERLVRGQRIRRALRRRSCMTATRWPSSHRCRAGREWV